MPSPNFKTADWRGIIRPDLHPPNELVTLLLRLPRDLADDVALAADEYRRHFDSDEELIATAVGFAINSLAEEPLRETNEPRTTKKSKTRKADH
jgi:hypothetical protein